MEIQDYIREVISVIDKESSTKYEKNFVNFQSSVLVRKNTMQEIIRLHLQRYPLITHQDLYKLVYQSAFAGGHMIASPEKSLTFLREECAQFEADVAYPLYETIGGGLIRINLQPLSHYKIPIEDVNRLFVETANTHKGDKAQFEEWLRIIEIKGFDDYREAMAKQGYPLVSHSDIYRKAYNPHYRVISLQKLHEYSPALVQSSR